MFCSFSNLILKERGGYAIIDVPPPLRGWWGAAYLSCCPGRQVCALSLCNEKPAVSGDAAVLGSNIGQLLLQRLAVNPGAADLLPRHLAGAAPQLVRVQLGHPGLDLILNTGDLGLGLFNQALQAPDLVNPHVQFVSAQVVISFQFAGLCFPLSDYYFTLILEQSQEKIALKSVLNHTNNYSDICANSTLILVYSL